MNRGEIYNGHFAGHCWLYYGDRIYDPSVGSWRELNAVKAEMERYGRTLGPMQWNVTLPAYWFKPCAELETPWQPTGTPELGRAWYGPFIFNIADARGDAINVAEMVRRFASIHEDVGQQIATGISSIKREFARTHGIAGHEEDDTVYPLQFKVRVGPASAGTGSFIKVSA